MPWWLPLLLLATGTELQIQSQNRKEKAANAGMQRAIGAENKRQDKFDREVQVSRDKYIEGLTAEKQSQAIDSAAADRQALYAKTALQEADSGYTPAAAGGAPRVIQAANDQIKSAADVFSANSADAMSRLKAYDDSRQAEAQRIAPITRDIARTRDFAGRSAALLPAEVEAARAAGMAKGRKSAMWGQILSTLGAAGMAAPGVAEGIGGVVGKVLGKSALPTVVEASAVPGAMSAAAPAGVAAATGVTPMMSLAPTAGVVASNTLTPMAAKGVALTRGAQVASLLPTTENWLRTVRISPGGF